MRFYLTLIRRRVIGIKLKHCFLVVSIFYCTLLVMYDKCNCICRRNIPGILFCFLFLFLIFISQVF